jgi:hypothetical protein
MSRNQRAVYADKAFPINMEEMEIVYGGVSYPDGAVHVFTAEQLDRVSADDLKGGNPLVVHVPGMARQDVYNHIKGLGYAPGIDIPVIEHPWCMIRADKLHEIANAAVHGVPSEKGRLAIVCLASSVLPFEDPTHTEYDSDMVPFLEEMKRQKALIEECVEPRRLVVLAKKQGVEMTAS